MHVSVSKKFLWGGFFVPKKEDSMAQTGLEFKLQEMAGRIRTLREIVELTPAKMAEKTGVSVEE